MHVERTVATLRRTVSAWRVEGLTVALVPTMGALHEGHLSLVRQAKSAADRVVVSLFVNPRQFAAQEDLGAYPRHESRDAALLAGVGADALFAPEAAEIYPDGFATEVRVSGVTDDLEGSARPHFFGGVATVVTKLLLQCLPDVAVFGEKDYQQLLTIRRLTADLDIPVRIAAGATVRELDGLAMSSRNAYLSPDERRVAVRLNAILRDTAEVLARGGAIRDAELNALAGLGDAGFGPIDYVAVRDAGDLKALPGPTVDRPARLLAAAWLGRTRLIDNLSVERTPKE